MKKGKMMATAVTLLSTSSSKIYCRAFTNTNCKSVLRNTQRRSQSSAFLSSIRNTSFITHNRHNLLSKTDAWIGLHHVSSKSVHLSSATDTELEKTTDFMNYDENNKSKGIVGKYEPNLFESDIYKWWEESGCFDPDSRSHKSDNSYVIPMPPPNVTGRLHMGHAIFVALQDVLARFHRMRGRPVLWLPGKDLFIFIHLQIFFTIVLFDI